jgi:hypothetical protein
MHPGLGTHKWRTTEDFWAWIIGIYSKLWIIPRDTSYEGKFAG